MKRAVDLTEDGKFSKPERNTTNDPEELLVLQFFDFIDKEMKKITAKPWDWENHTVTEGFEDEFQGENEIIFTGNKSQRALKKHGEKQIIGLICENCGNDFSNKPWGIRYGICETCKKKYQRSSSWRTM